MGGVPPAPTTGPLVPTDINPGSQGMSLLEASAPGTNIQQIVSMAQPTMPAQGSLPLAASFVTASPFVGLAAQSNDKSAQAIAQGDVPSAAAVVVSDAQVHVQPAFHPALAPHLGSVPDPAAAHPPGGVVATEPPTTIAADNKSSLEPEEHELVSNLVQEVIDKAIEADRLAAMMDPDAPAAMAAKLRSRTSAAAAEAKPDTSKKDKEKDKSAREDNDKQIQGPVPSIAGAIRALSQYRPNKNDGPVPQPTWVHEKHLPNWLIREYEENVSL